MRRFSDEEFEKMISEITDTSNASFNTLCIIADKALRPKVRYWCTTSSVLNGRQMEEDIMQEIFIRLIKTVTYGFLLRKDNNYELNRNPDEFNSWIFKVAENIFKDTLKAVRTQDYRIKRFDAMGDSIIADNQIETSEAETHIQDELLRAFNIVFDSDKKVYIVLTWLAQNLFVLEFGITKIKSIRIMADALSDRTLFELKDIVLKHSERIKWLKFSDKQSSRITRALNEYYKGKLLGEYQYKEFYMKKGGRASISDWVNRMNRMIESLI